MSSGYLCRASGLITWSVQPILGSFPGPRPGSLIFEFNSYGFALVSRTGRGRSIVSLRSIDW